MKFVFKNSTLNKIIYILKFVKTDKNFFSYNDSENLFVLKTKRYRQFF